MLRKSCFAAAAALAAGYCVAALADQASDAREGQALADKVCSPCHVTSEQAGPTFSEIAKGAHASPDALKNFLSSTHASVSHPNAMPNPELTDQQINEIAAYLASLRGK